MSTNFDKSDSENSDGFVVPDRPILDTSEISPLTAEKLTKVREWLQPTAYDISGGEYRKHASSYLLGTGNWLTSSPEYQRWLMSRDDGLLWIKGIPGSGKSVMAAKIIAELAASDSKCPVLYFFFRQIIHANHDPVALLRDWMDQLLERSPVLQRRLYSYVKDNQSLKSVSPDVMWKDLKMALAAFPERIYCVADALDEMDQGNGEFLVSLANLGHWQPDKVKVLITSRPVPGVEVPLHSVPCLKIRLREDKVDNDISRFVEHCLETSQIDRNHWPAIINAVPGNASGLFLYARLAMDAFLEPGVDVETAIAHLPTDLNVLYTGLLREHIARSGVEDHVQNMMLQAATHTTRPLRLLEMAEMIGVVDAERDLKTRKELVKAACGPLLEILADETVSVIHHSFTEYLKGVTRAKDDTGYPALNPATTHEALALTCLRYLQNGSLDNFSAEILEYEPQRPIRDTKVAFCQRYPFLKYASGNWHKHVVAACSASSDDTLLLTEVLQFLDNDHLRRVWCCIEQGSVESDTPKAHVAAKLGLTGYVQALIDRDEDVDFLDSYRRTPLWWAADKGHSDTVQVLIAAGVKVDRDDTLGGYTALHQAARANHLSVVELLLQAGVSPMIRRGPRAARYYSAHHMPKYGKSPLQCACVNGRLETVDAMIKYVKNPRITHWALAWATCSGQSRLVSLLLENSSVDVNIKVHGDTLLYLACGSLDIDTINILLQAGADVTALSLGAEHPLNVDIDYTPEPRGSPTQTCLHGMLQNDNLEIILSNSTYAIDLKQLFTKLFTAGLDVNQRDGAGKTLLHRVTQFPELVELLVSAGADAQAVDINNNTPLHFITNPGVISTLVVNGGADVNAVNKDGQTPLHRTHSEAVMLKLLKYGSDPNILDKNDAGADPTVLNYDGLTPLHLAARAKQSNIIGMLLKAVHDRLRDTPSEETDLLNATVVKYRYNVYDEPFKVTALFYACADINAVDSQGRSCLDLAGYSTELVDLLISNGAVVRSSSIFAALEADNATALKKLLQAGVGANGRMPYVEDHLREEDRPDRCYLGDDCMTFDLARIPRHEMVPLYYVASKPTFPEDPDTRGCFRTLLKHGADIYATFHVLPTRREVARAYGGDFNKLLGIIEANDGEAGRRSVLHELVRLGKLSKCVIDAVDIDAGCLDSKGCTLLHAVCDSWGGPDGVINTTSDNDDDDAEDADENITAFKQLLAIGCDIQARDNNGQSIVHHMIYSGWKHPFQLGRLKKSLEEISLIAPNLLSAPNASGNTPLHYSTLLATPTRKIITVDCRVYEPIQAQQGLMVELTRLLLRHGASPAGANQDGNSVLHFMARNLDRKDVAAQFAELVRDHGLDVNARNALGETPLMLLANRTAVLLRSCTGGNSGLDYSLRLDSEAAAERVAMLAALGADFQVTDEHGNGLLHLAATDGVQLFKAVMDRGALDPTMENHAHQTAIDVAATYNNNEILALFKKEV
ncbi:hypothetical protein V2A60_002170 [Cordyceps javanica]